MSVGQQDLYRYVRSTSSGAALRCFFKHPGFRFVRLKRLCESYSAVHPVGLIARLWYKRMQVKFGFQVPHTCKIGPGFFMGHYGNIVFNQDAVVGANCNVAQGVTLGHVSRGSKTGSPTLGDRVWVGANAVVVGKISIGNDVLIAPLAYVNFDVPDNALVIGNPATIVKDKGSAGYINNTLS
ncbi:serine O-acetyltransferase [Chryseolinea lacunae]|uniref:Serine acetyltransferase n=1 Tax=Chryseolinea lacunae TaxID=2801331 RepID=A0ABS1KX90_9BACT|nr:serine acetyltransferase [Chryseolinea lacunae]MBL0744024.1 serine acetyltransferase [Chryseolinea lacunae]